MSGPGKWFKKLPRKTGTVTDTLSRLGTLIRAGLKAPLAGSLAPGPSPSLEAEESRVRAYAKSKERERKK